MRAALTKGKIWPRTKQESPIEEGEKFSGWHLLGGQYKRRLYKKKCSPLAEEGSQVRSVNRLLATV